MAAREDGGSVEMARIARMISEHEPDEGVGIIREVGKPNETSQSRLYAKPTREYH